MKITFEILSYWRVGTGQARGGTLDAVCARDGQGLPYIPGRQVRGLLREALTDAIELEWLKNVTVDDLFGQNPPKADQAAQPDTKPGTLRFENARLADADRRALVTQPELKDRLFDTRRSTAIDPGTGTAKNRSLRFEEVAIPLTLIAEVSPLADAPANWFDCLDTAAPLIRGIGSGRNRGLGRVIVTCEQER